MNGAYLDGSAGWTGFTTGDIEICRGTATSGFWWPYVSD